MQVIGEPEGLDIEAFRTRARWLFKERYGNKWANYYSLIDLIP
jgi:hypothetical protein